MEPAGGRVRLLAAFLRRVGNFALDTFADRLTFQKTVYFLQVFGFYLGYRFSWYLYGPYSPDLTRDGFELKDRISHIAPVSLPNAQIEQRFEQFMRFLGDYRSDPQALELLASIHFLRKLDPTKPKGAIVERLKAKQRHFTDERIRQAWEYLRKFDLTD